MLLQELTGVKAHAGKTASSLLYMLKNEYGIKISHGAYGIVLMHPDWDHVLKFSAKDEAYEQFVEWAIKKSNPHLPKFKKKPLKLSTFFKSSFGTDITAWSGGFYEKIEKVYVTKIEKLQPIDKKTWALCEYISDWNFIQKYGRVIGTKEEDEFLEDPPMTKSWKFGTVWKGNTDLTPYKSLCETIIDISDMLPQGAFADFNEGNFMMRGDTIVITDPYAAQDPSMGLEVDRIFKTKELNDLAGPDAKKTVDTMANAFNRF